MRWSALILGVSGLIISGCQQPEKNLEPVQNVAVDYGTMQPDLYAADATETSPAFTGESPDEPLTLSATTPPDSLSTGTTTHIVLKGDTLFGLARTYYNDASQWRVIFERNSSILADPDKLRIGQELVIP